jgi:hypothetical protein
MRPLFSVFVVAAACSSTTSDPVFDVASSAPLSFAVTADPPPTAQGIYRDATIRVVIDDYPDPNTVDFAGVQLRSGKNAFDGTLSVDLVGRAILFKPRSLLEAGLTYELVITPKMHALDGRAAHSEKVFEIAVGPDVNPSPPAPPAPVTWAADLAVTIGGCAPFCHSPVGKRNNLRNPTRGLDLTGDPHDTRLGLVYAPSVGLAGTPYQLNRVTPHDSARSVLVRKLIGGNAHASSKDPPYPEMQVDGRRMPILLDENAPAPNPLDDATIRLVQDWIDQGAN